MSLRLRAGDLLALVPAAALPLIFLHRIHQPSVSFRALDVYASDVAVWATVAAAVVAGVRFGWDGLGQTRALWAVLGAFLGLLALSCFWTPLDESGKHLVTWAKLLEYALLAPCLVLLLRTRIQVDRFLVAVVAWSVVASSIAILQFVGLVNGIEGTGAGDRQGSFVGIHDFAAVSGAVAAIGFAGLLLRERPRLAAVALASGAIGALLAASVFVFAGLVLAAAAAVWTAARAGRLSATRTLALGGILLAMAAGVVALRSYDVGGFFSFVSDESTEETREGVQTGSHRATLAYIGLRIWLDHPVLGVGFQRSTDRYEPYLDDARRRFPDQPDEAFPSPEHRWGVQNSWVQLLADVGLVGFLLGLASFGVALRYALRAPPPALFAGTVAAGWILVAAGGWAALGIVAGVPLQGVTWLGFGLAATVVTVR